MTAATASTATRSRPHVPALDGVRGLAILIVFFHNTSMIARDAASPADRVFARVTEGGWCGVDLFFVLSGFLITGILLDAKHSSRYYRNFFLRRTVRIFPLYYAFLALNFVVLPNLPAGWVPSSFFAAVEEIGGDQAWFWVYLANFSIAAEGWRSMVLDVAWSLSVEEQFYLLWPAVVHGLGRRSLMRLCVALMAAAFLVRLGLSLAGANPIAIYVLTPARMDALAMGAWVALALRGPAGAAGLRRVRLAAGAALAAITAVCVWRAGFGYKDPVVHTVGFTLIALLGGGVLAQALGAAPGDALRRVLELRWLCAFGKYSYAIYLFHMPLRAVVRDAVYGPDDFVAVLGAAFPGQLLFYALALPVTFGAARLSWWLLEEPFLRLKRYGS